MAASCEEFYQNSIVVTTLNLNFLLFKVLPNLLVLTIIHFIVKFIT
jgi:hypothetical protein